MKISQNRDDFIIKLGRQTCLKIPSKAKRAVKQIKLFEVAHISKKNDVRS